MPLSNKQKRYLRALAHKLKPVVLIGGNGLSEGLLAELESTLAHHELIKIKFATGDRQQRQHMLEDICARCRADTIQVIGRTATIYRAGEKRRIAWPTGA